MNTKELEKILKLHEEWLVDNTKGKRADLSWWDLKGINFKGADLWGVYFTNANLSGANLSDANLSDTYLNYTDLTGAKLRNTILTGADLEGVIGKFIFTFQMGRDFAYYADGIVKIGCISLTIDKWIKHAREIGERNGYSKNEIKLYLTIIKQIPKLLKIYLNGEANQ